MYMDFRRIIHPNRELFYFIAISTLIALGLFYAVQTFVIDQDALIDDQPLAQKPISTTPNTLDTSGWKTYRNEKYGFEFKYPTGNTVEVDVIPRPNLFVVSIHPFPYQKEDTPFTLTVGDNQPYQQVGKCTAISMDGAEGFQCLLDLLKSTFIKRSNSTIIIKYYPDQVTDRIFSTLTFFEPKNTLVSQCKVGYTKHMYLPLGSRTWKIIGSQGGECVTEYTEEVEGGYTTYRCLLALQHDDIDTQLANIDLASCQKVKSGNLLLEQIQ